MFSGLRARASFGYGSISFVVVAVVVVSIVHVRNILFPQQMFLGRAKRKIVAETMYVMFSGWAGAYVKAHACYRLWLRCPTPQISCSFFKFDLLLETLVTCDQAEF